MDSKNLIELRIRISTLSQGARQGWDNCILRKGRPVRVQPPWTPRLDWKEELEVIKHLGPQAAINERAEMFDEHAVFVRRHRLRSLLGVNFDSEILGRFGCSCWVASGFNCGGQQ